MVKSQNIATKVMNELNEKLSQRSREGVISAVSAGFFFVLIGAIFIITPNLFNRIPDFFRDFDVVQVPNTGIFLPAPVSPRIHSTVYVAVEQFSFAFGLFQIAILALRIVIRSPWSKKAETVSNFIFWIGTGYLTRTLLIETTRHTATTAWFVFWAGIIMLLGVSFIVRAIILAIAFIRPKV